MSFEGTYKDNTTHFAGKNTLLAKVLGVLNILKHAWRGFLNEKKPQYFSNQLVNTRNKHRGQLGVSLPT